jgi:isopentenyl-diphosphate delta-isomerase|tara:strand:- start:3564 stop:4076 length:513 start_codon:yes stop_codon:yes gene_type:complete
MDEMVILVDKNDNQLGLMEKIEAHKKAVLHRAFSVFILNENNELLLQKRALSKYHSPGLWTNTCCSHPRDGESVINAGIRRLSEEMGFETELNTLFSFIYKAEFDNGLTEHEFDHVLLGRYNKNPLINKLEVSDWRWIDVELLKKDVVVSPYLYTVWFKIIFQQFHKKFK